MADLEAVLERREKDNRVVVNQVKQIILDALKPETLKRLRKGEGYLFHSVYNIGIGTVHLGFSEHSLVNYLGKQDSRFNTYDISSAIKDLGSEKKIAYLDLDLSSAHNPDDPTKLKRIYYLPENSSK